MISLGSPDIMAISVSYQNNLVCAYKILHARKQLCPLPPLPSVVVFSVFGFSRNPRNYWNNASFNDGQDSFFDVFFHIRQVSG